MSDTLRIESQQQFLAWLESNFWLEEATIELLDPIPMPQAIPPGDVRLGFRLQLSGGYGAGELRRVRDLQLRVTGVSGYTISEAGGFMAGHCCHGVELLDVPHGIGFTIDVPAILRLIGSAIDVEYEDRDETIAAWYSDREFFASVPIGSLPTPAEWLAWCRGRGLDVVWRYYASEEIPPEDVPQRDYSGWFLQDRSRLIKDPQGLFFFSGREADSGFRISVRDDGGSHRELWNAAADFVAGFPDVIVHCGNAKLSQDEWQRLRVRQRGTTEPS